MNEVITFVHKLIKAKFIKKYWYDIIKNKEGFSVFNTQRKRNQIDRDGIGHEIAFLKTLKRAEEFLNNYKGD